MTVLNTRDLNEDAKNRVFSSGREDWTWKLSVMLAENEGVPKKDSDGKIRFPAGTDFEIISKNAGHFLLGIYPDENGQPAFDRPVYNEGEGVATVTWGYERDGSISVLLVHEARPAASIIPLYAHCVRHIGGYDHMMFAHCAMGFATDTALYRRVGTLINYEATAKQEVLEELGSSAVVEIFNGGGGKFQSFIWCILVRDQVCSIGFAKISTSTWRWR